MHSLCSDPKSTRCSGYAVRSDRTSRQRPRSPRSASTAAARYAPGRAERNAIALAAHCAKRESPAFGLAGASSAIGRETRNPRQARPSNLGRRGAAKQDKRRSLWRRELAGTDSGGGRRLVPEHNPRPVRRPAADDRIATHPSASSDATGRMLPRGSTRQRLTRTRSTTRSRMLTAALPESRRPEPSDPHASLAYEFARSRTSGWCGADD